MKQMNKKGAIEITATAIVVFIIAIVVLGAMILLIKSFFEDITPILQKQTDQLKQTLKPQLTAGQKIVFDFGDELKMKSGAKSEVYIGIQNDYANKDSTKDSICFRVALRCIRAFTGANDNKCQGLLVGGVESSGDFSQSKKWFSDENILKFWDIKNNDFDLQPIPLQPRVPSDTYLLKTEVYKEKDDANCENPSFEDKPYYSKQFRLIVQ